MSKWLASRISDDTNATLRTTQSRNASISPVAFLRSDLPDPFVPADVDLTGMPGFIIDVDKLLGSELNAIGRPDEKWAFLTLCLRAFRQIPAGSLPDDDRVLAAFSGDPRMWKKLKGVALRGWVKCSDGRLHHRVLAYYILIAWESRHKQKARCTTAKTDRQMRWRANLSEMSKHLRDSGVKVPAGASLATMRRLLVDAERVSSETTSVDPDASRETGIKYKSTSTRYTSHGTIGSDEASVPPARTREDAPDHTLAGTKAGWQ